MSKRHVARCVLGGVLNGMMSGGGGLEGMLKGICDEEYVLKNVLKGVL